MLSLTYFSIRNKCHGQLFLVSVIPWCTTLQPLPGACSIERYPREWQIAILASLTLVDDSGQMLSGAQGLQSFLSSIKLLCCGEANKAGGHSMCPRLIYWLGCFRSQHTCGTLDLKIMGQATPVRPRS